MNDRYILFVACLVILMTGVTAQCPDRSLVMSRMLELKSSSVPFQEQKSELLTYVTSLEKCPVQADTVLVHLLQRTGALSYLSAEYADAVLYTTRAVELLRTMPATYTNYPLLVRMYHYLNIFYDSLQLKRLQIAAIDSSVHFALTHEIFNNEILNNLMQRVEYSYHIGEYKRCLTDAEIGEKLTTLYAAGTDSSLYASVFFTHKVNSLTDLGQTDEAERLLTERLEMLKATGRIKEGGVLYNQLSNVFVRQQKPMLALQSLQQSFECNRLMAFALGCKQSLNNIGYFYFSTLHKPDHALYYYFKALRYHAGAPQEKSIDRAEDANILGNIANVYVKRGNYDSAFRFFDRAFYTALGFQHESKLANIPPDELVGQAFIHYLAALVKDKGDAFAARAHTSNDKKWLDSAIRVYYLADQLFATILKEQSEMMSQLTWRRMAKSTYAAALEACYRSNRLEDAFSFLERSRAILLQKYRSVNLASDPGMIMQVAALDRRIDSLSKVSGGMSKADRRSAELQEHMYAMSRQRDRLHAMLVPREQLQVVDYGSFRKTLARSDAAYLSMLNADSSVFLLLLGAGVERLMKIDRKKYDDLTSTFTQMLSSPAALNSEFSRFSGTSHQLYRLLFDQEKIPGKRLIFSPDAMYIPLEALITAFINGNPQYLLKQMPVTYTYSATFLSGIDSARGLDDQPSYVGFAPGSFPASYQLHILPGNAEALRRVSSLFAHNNIWADKDATRRAFLDNYYRYNLVQLNTHASAGEGREPVIYFSDSVLMLSELLAVPQPATKIIILSACETGKGKLYEGEGVFSFNRSFAELGVPSAVVNSWSVDNHSAYRITELFCQYLGRGEPSDIALQKAKLDYIHEADGERQLPFYWAAPLLVGQVVTFMPADPAGWDWLVWLAAAIFVVAGGGILGRAFQVKS